MKKENQKRGRGRPRKETAKPEQKKRTVSQEPLQQSEKSPTGIITEGELLEKVNSVRETGEELPAEHQTEIEPGTQLESDLINLAAGKGDEPATENAEQEKPAATPGEPIQGDVIAEMENNMLLVPLEEGFDLPKGFLVLNDGDQNLLSMVRPDDMEIKKTPEWYWGIFSLLNVSKFMKWYFYNLRKKKEAKKKAEEKKKSLPDELTRKFEPAQ